MEANKEQMRALARTTQRFAEAMRQGIARTYDPVRVGVLNLAAEHGPLRAGEIAVRLDALPSSVTRHVRILVDSGLVTATPDPADRRAVLVEATAAGRTELADFQRVGDEVFGAVIADWSAEDVVALTGLLDRMVEAWLTRGVDQQERVHHPARFVWSRS
ncbi:MarR family transcriptional regulator [Nocardia terpenica]|uniref:MarR family winged helix-turn-helix transcriptional regulator n=1 Tax=Nocardia terpenica TaxID=455432 RepID=UPI001894F89E|nr:MarR family transcriptional regulator [Nocardia terpenica]MBF6064585.1 MarR family transcriptional regulator [Nocardia terpenica]MBF6106791.1 MarR family transcriptional regulator [Nocardia terpenica]MBF6114553.1 MarR family transcriptional regulator [Nocardia terpenica]MBF6121361.1 MarR family transcriptional regulator [Nocardia terpenica]MBF6153776.1 MarR family transcriptional regulator [Nocardia terpenica]